MNNKFSVIPLGGAGEVGRNCFLYRCGNDAIIIDFGRKIFRETDPRYKDDREIFPDFTMVTEGQVRLFGIVLLHGHLDHVGALVAFESDILHVPVYASAWTKMFYRMHFDYNHNEETRQRLFQKTVCFVPGETLALGPFSVRTFPLHHSIRGACGAVISAGGKTAVHMGDAKMSGAESFDPLWSVTWQSLTPPPMEVDLLVLDTVNAGMPGFTPGENMAIQGIAEVIREKSLGRVLVAQFATNLDRMSMIVNEARKLGKSVGFCGAGIRVAAEILGYGIAFGRRYGHGFLPHNGEVVFVSGSQSEPWSALWRAAEEDSNDLKPHLCVSPHDTIVLSSRAIPSVKDDVCRMVELLLGRGAHVILHEGESAKMGLVPQVEERFVHVSGHGQDEDLKLMCRMLRPRKVLAHHAEPETLAFVPQLLGDVIKSLEVVTPNNLEEVEI